MKTDLFFKNFAHLAEAPNGITSLKQIAISLAVQGKLVAQRNTDNNACQLLESISIERHSLIRIGVLKDRDSLPDVQLEEILFDIPKTWKWTRLRNISYELGQKVPNDKFTYIDVSSINNQTGVICELPAIIEAHDAPSRARKLVQQNTVIFSTVRPSLLNIAIIEKVYNPAPIASTAFFVLNPFSGVDSKYLFYWLRSKNFSDYASAMSTGIAYPAINDAKMQLALIPLPPENEQKRIVAKVDELMALCDELEAKQRKRNTVRLNFNNASLSKLYTARTPKEFTHLWTCIHENFKEFTCQICDISKLRQLILQLAVKGKLVPQIMDGKSDKDCINQDAKHVPCICGWKWMCVGEMFDVCGGIQKTPNRNPKNNFFPYLRVGNVYRGRLDLDRIEHFELYNGELEKWRLNDNDLLIVEGNGSESEIGRCAIWHNEIKDCVHQNHIIRCRPLGKVNSAFASVYFNSPSGINEMKRLAITTSGLYSLSVGKIRSIKMPQPPKEEQCRIVAKVDQLMSLCDALESRLSRSEKGIEHLMKSFVHHLTAC